MKMKTKILLFIALLLSIFDSSKNANSQTVTDIDGNVYNQVTIGTQTWLKENLTVTKYKNGDLIGTTVPDTLDISGQTEPKYQWPSGGKDSTLALYGRLYTWYAATDSRNICPSGWHVHTKDELMTLINYVCGIDSAGGKLKEMGTSHWTSPNTGADNSFGFSDLPGGYRNPSWNPRYLGVGSGGFWWSSSIFFSTYGNQLNIDNDNADIKAVTNNGNAMNSGLSIRCLMGGTTGIDNRSFPSPFKLSPNPGSGKFYIEISNRSDNKIDVQVFNLLGEVIYSTSNFNQKNSNEMDLSSFPKGIYFVKISNISKVYMEKVIIQ